MLSIHVLPLGVGIIISFSLLLNGCSMGSPLQKPEIGPAGAPTQTKSNPPILQRFQSPPAELYDIEATTGVMFEGIVKKDWSKAETSLTTLRKLWGQVQPQIGEKKGVKETNEALQSLSGAIMEKKTGDAYENLTKFMSGISDIGKSYKLSPISDIIGVGIGIRNVSFYAMDQDWSKAKTKMKELEGSWGQAKPNMESVGILGKVTTTHTIIKQLKDAIDAENKGSVTEHIANVNESMGYIRDYYRGK